MLCLSCSRQEAAPAPQGPRKPRVDLTVWLDHEPEGDPATAVAISTKSPPKERLMMDKTGVRVAVIGVPADADVMTFLPKQVQDAEKAGSNATLIVSTRCLADLAPAIDKQIYVFWNVPL